MANLTELKVDWKEQKSKLQKRFALLTEDGLMFDESKREALIRRLQFKLGKTKEQIDAIILGL
jgi:hypothetical protein